MNMKMMQRLFLTGLVALTVSLAGCADDGGSGDELFLTVVNDPDGPFFNPANCESDDSILDGAQCSVTVLVDDLAAIFNGTPLEDFIQCIDPLANELVDGPDSVLNTILTALATQNPDPADFEAAIMDLATALASLGTNLPCALLALSGDNEAIAACNAGGCPDSGEPIPLDPTQLNQLCALPEVGPALVGGLGGACP